MNRVKYAKTGLARAIGLASVLAILPLGASAKQEAIDLKIAAQATDAALIKLAQVSGVQILFPPEIARGVQSQSVDGNLTVTEAMNILLQDTNLYYQVVSDKMIVVKQNSSARKDSKDGSGRVVDPEKTRQIEEMVVTATKRETGLQDTAMSITAMGEDEIDKKGLVGADYLRSVPNINYVEFTPGFSTVTIRGLNGGFGTQDLSSTYLGEVPLSFPLVNLTFKSDAKLVDLERVEVLRGPQGTLWGANSMSGLVRNIPQAPKLDRFEGHIDIGVSSVAHSDDLSNKQVGVLNIPLVEDRLALRVAAYRFDNAGFRDLVNTPYAENAAAFTGTTVATEKDDNPSEFTGGRATLLWQVNDRLDLTLMVGHQKDELNGRNAYSVSNPDAGSYRGIALEEEPGYTNTIFRFTHFLLDYDLGWATLTSASTWVDHEQVWRWGDVNYLPIAWVSSQEPEMQGFMQEIRLSSQLNSSLQYTVGLYYEDLDAKRYIYNTWIGTQASLEALGWAGTDPLLQDMRQMNTSSQVALFGEIDYAISEQWSVTLGGRWFDYEREYVEEGKQFTTMLNPEPLGVNEQGDTLKAGIEFTPNDETMLYATWAEGFRLGRGQSVPPSATCDVDGDGFLDSTNARLTDKVNSDRSENYELGARLTWLDNRLMTNATLYRVDWNDIPVIIGVTTDTCNAAVTNNSGRARSQGLELEVRYQVTPSLEVTLGAGYNDTEFLDDLVGGKGDRLPLAPEYNGNLGLEYHFSLTGRPSFVRSDYTFSGGSYPDVSRFFPRTGAYGQWSLRAGMDFERVSVQVFGKNLTNEDEITYQDPGGVWQLSPRELGVDVKYHF